MLRLNSAITTPLAAIILMICSDPVRAESDCLKIAVSSNPLIEQIAPSLFQSLLETGICMRAETIANERRRVMLRSGAIDGDLYRVRAYQAKVGAYAVRVSEPIAQGHGLIISLAERSLELDALKGKSIGVMRGAYWTEELALDNFELVMVDSYASALAMLKTHRLSAVLIDSISFSKLNTKNAEVLSRRVTPQRSAFLYLHKRHEDLVPRLNKAIRRWKQEFYHSAGGT